TSSRYTERIKMSELKKGDLVMDAEGTNTTRHVVIFEKWANAGHTSYWAYEQRGRYGTDHRILDYGLSSGSEYKAYRPVKLSDAGRRCRPCPVARPARPSAVLAR